MSDNKFKPVPPTHNVLVATSNNGRLVEVGVAWMKEDGVITVRLNTMVDLGRMKQGDKIMIFPRDYVKRTPARGSRGKGFENTEESLKDLVPDLDDGPDLDDSDNPEYLGNKE